MQITTYGRSVIALGATSLALMGGGTAYAYWTTTGTGTGSATATTSQPLVLTSPVAVSDLYPTAANLAGGTVTVTNPNPFRVTLTTATLTGTVTTAKVGCTGTTVTLAASLPADPVVAADGGTATIAVTASMSNAAEDACQGATFTQPLTVTAESVS